MLAFGQDKTRAAFRRVHDESLIDRGKCGHLSKASFPRGAWGSPVVKFRSGCNKPGRSSVRRLIPCPQGENDAPHPLPRVRRPASLVLRNRPRPDGIGPTREGGPGHPPGGDSPGRDVRGLAALRIRADGYLLAADGAARHIKIINSEGKNVGPDRTSPPARGIQPGGRWQPVLWWGGQTHQALSGRQGHQDRPVPPTRCGRHRRRRARGKPVRISGIAVSDRDVFVAFGSGWSTGSKSKLYRFGLDWENPKLLDEGLRGCCQRCDIRSGTASSTSPRTRLTGW